METVIYDRVTFEELPRKWQKEAIDWVADCINEFYIEHDNEELRNIRVNENSGEVKQYIEEHVYTITVDEWERVHIDVEGRY